MEMTAEEELNRIHAISFTERQWQLLCGMLLIQAGGMQGNIDPEVVIYVGVLIEELGMVEGLMNMVSDIQESYGVGER